MKGIVDRIEDGIVTLEVNNNYFNISIELFPNEIKEGDLVEYQDQEFVILVDETKAREAKIQDLFNSLIERE